MRRPAHSDHLAHSFTDLMTSLMVIFILLLVVFLNNQAAMSGAAARVLVSDLQQGNAGPLGYSVSSDPNNPGTVFLTIPSGALSFLSNRRELGSEGLSFLQNEMPKLARLLCSGRYRHGIESIVVEGHSDSTQYRGVSLEESQSLNLKLSQDRSMEVVRRTLQYLSDKPDDRACLLEKLSASGRGEQDSAASMEKSRRVVLKVRMNAGLVPALNESLRTELGPVANGRERALSGASSRVNVRQ